MSATKEPNGSMSLRPFFSYFGSKWRTAPKYGAPRYNTIVEPFAGSAGYACRFPDRRVILCDADPTISSLWRWLIAARPEEILALPDIGDGTTADLDVRPEARSLIGFWLNRGAEAPRHRASQWMRSGIRPRSFWGDHARSMIASQVERIRHWTVLDDYREASEIGPASWFIDPPYALAGRKYRVGSDRIDFAALADWCRARQGQIIVCENEGASWLPFATFGVTRVTAGRNRAGVSREAVWFGGDA